MRAQELLTSTPAGLYCEPGGFHIDPDQILYALHGADGARLAVMSDRATAVAAAQAHELAVVSLH